MRKSASRSRPGAWLLHGPRMAAAQVVQRLCTECATAMHQTRGSQPADS
ncbi:hypothetical protein [Segatella buccae]|uniref:Uncharacterized protein n=1 Tax=Segatella buccae ATCC 33574 TaxID=873513 RepID=E6K3K3_9BACT|nr:hypothetical protein [Segatella buccae]EFC75353.1 hypothetical protein HMPREF0649_01651 [Segatella buccae D17]EFU31771.1 hypothetical protein HMPREF6485_0156 [Segatella buccae ATCC 33574]